jgi:o-succinylbenzoate---CoA ligase
MDFKNYRELRINGQSFAAEDLKNYSLKKTEDPASPEWEKSVFQFILDWLNDSPFVQSQTSGSTGMAKNIRLAKNKMLNSAIKIGEFLQLKKGGPALLCLPVKYIAGKMMIVRAIALGLDLHLSEPSGNPSFARGKDFDFAAMVPMQVFQILEQNNGIEKLNRIKNLIIGGSAIPAELAKKIQILKNNCFSTYGMTETLSHIAMRKLNGPSADGFYHLLPGIQIETDKRKCLIINAPDLTEVPIVTNDIVELKDKGFKVKGRYDNLIISGGINISPEGLEKRLEKFISKRFIVSALPDEKLGQRLVLVIEGQSWTKNEISGVVWKISKELAKFEIPKQIMFLTKFPEIGNQKIDRLGIKNRIESP